MGEKHGFPELTMEEYKRAKAKWRMNNPAAASQILCDEAYSDGFFDALQLVRRAVATPPPNPAAPPAQAYGSTKSKGSSGDKGDE